MKKTYHVIVTRNTTESAIITVQAKSPEDAESSALNMAADPYVEWEIDDNWADTPYVIDIEEIDGGES